jgi:hypothetical protein
MPFSGEVPPFAFSSCVPETFCPDIRPSRRRILLSQLSDGLELEVGIEEGF